MRTPTQLQLGKAVNLLALVQHEHRYVILYTDEHADKAINQLGRWAANRELNFTWADANALVSIIGLEARKS